MSRLPPRALALTLLLPALGSCSDLPAVTAGTCGNHVLDPGERCDHEGAGCGAPGSAFACAYTCDAGPCPTGWLCGRDHACRQATGGFDLRAPVGGGGDWFELLDVDGDGVRDLVDRGFHVATAYGYHGGAFAPIARGATDADLSVTRAFAAGRFRDDDARPILGVISVYSYDLFTVLPERGIVPVATATLRLPQGSQRFLGGVRFGTAAVQPLVYSADGPVLDALNLDQGQSDVRLDLSMCGAVKGSQTEAIVPGSGTQLAMFFDGKRVCAIDAVGSGTNARFTGTPLPIGDLTALSRDFHLSQPLLADLDGDHLPDVVGLLELPSTTGGKPERRFVVWRRDASGYGKPQISAPYLLSDDPYYGVSTAPVLATADFDGDGRDDLVDAYLIHLRAEAQAGDPFGPAHGVDINLYAFGQAIETGDIDHDGDADLIVSGEGQEGVFVCLNDGGARFACLAQDSGIPSVEHLFLGDVSGDSCNDLVAVGATPDPISGTSGSRLSITFGRPLGFPQPPAQYIEAYRAKVSGAALAPSPGDPSTGRLPNAADGLLVALQYADGTGFARSRGVPDALPAFGRAIPAYEARFSDHRLLVLRCDSDALGQNTRCAIQVFTGGSDAPFAATDIRPLSRQIDPKLTGYNSGLRFADLPDNPGPAAFWVESGGAYLGRLGDKQVDVTPVPTPGSFAGFFHAQIIDTDGPADPAGDGRAELVVATADAMDNCEVWTAHQKGGAMAPFVRVARVASCRHGSPIGFDADFGYGAPFFAGPPGASPDLYVTVKSADGTYHLARLPADGKGGFGAPVPDPAVFRTSATSTPGALPTPDDYRYADAADLDGDGVLDLLFRTSAGAVVAFSHSTL